MVISGQDGLALHLVQLVSFEQEEKVGVVLHASNPGICEVGAEDLKPMASLGYIHIKTPSQSKTKK